MESEYKNLKNGKTYEVLSWDVTNSTNEQDGQRMVLYVGEKNDYSGKRGFFVREINEFESKFVKKNEI